MKNNTHFDPFKNLVLDEYEKEIEAAFERGEYESVSKKEFEQSKRIFQQAAKNYLALQKSRSVTIRLNQLDLIKLKAKAKRKNIPYQTLLNSLVHQYVEGETKFAL